MKNKIDKQSEALIRSSLKNIPYPNDRDCKHGHLKRSCEICALEESWAEDHTRLQYLCYKAGYSKREVEGDQWGVPSIQDLGDMLLYKIQQREAAIVNFCNKTRWADPGYKAQPHIKALFDVEKEIIDEKK